MGPLTLDIRWCSHIYEFQEIRYPDSYRKSNFICSYSTLMIDLVHSRSFVKSATGRDQQHSTPATSEPKGT